MEKVVITIARQYGSGGRTIGQMLAKELGIHYYDKELLKLASEESGIHERLFAGADSTACLLGSRSRAEPSRSIQSHTPKELWPCTRPDKWYHHATCTLRWPRCRRRRQTQAMMPAEAVPRILLLSFSL